MIPGGSGALFSDGITPTNPGAWMRQKLPGELLRSVPTSSVLQLAGAPSLQGRYITAALIESDVDRWARSHHGKAERELEGTVHEPSSTCGIARESCKGPGVQHAAQCHKADKDSEGWNHDQEVQAYNAHRGADPP